MKEISPIEEYYQLKLKLELTDSEKKIFKQLNLFEVNEDKLKQLELTRQDYKLWKFQEFYKKWITYKDKPPYKKAKRYR